MRLGRLEIRWSRLRGGSGGSTQDEVDRTGAFAVPDTEPWWLAVHQVIDEAEAETIQGARNRIQNANACIAAVGAGEGCALVRQKLEDKREIALRQNPAAVTAEADRRLGGWG
jgi:hypothetical protein